METVIIECLNTAAKGDGHRSGLLSQAAQLAARCDLRTARYREALERALASDGCRLYPEAKEALLERLR